MTRVSINARMLLICTKESGIKQSKAILPDTIGSRNLIKGVVVFLCSLIFFARFLYGKSRNFPVIINVRNVFLIGDGFLFARLPNLILN